MKSDEGFAPVDTRQALADSVGLSRDTMSKVMRIDECAPASIKEALDSSVISINRGYDITRELSELPEDEREQAALEAVIKEMNRKEERKLKEADDRYRIAKAYNAGFEHAALMRISDENISTWVEQSGITYRQLDHLIREARAISKNFMRIADFLENTVKAKHWRNAANG